MFSHLAIFFVILVLTSWVLGWRRIRVPQQAGGSRPRSRAVYHGFYNALWCALPMLAVALAWLAVEPWIIRPIVLHALAENTGQATAHEAFRFVEIRNLASGVLPMERADEAVRRAREWTPWSGPRFT